MATRYHRSLRHVRASRGTRLRASRGTAAARARARALPVAVTAARTYRGRTTRSRATHLKPLALPHLPNL